MDAGSPEESRYSLTLQLAAASRRYLSHRVERKPPAPLLRGIEVRNFRNIRAAKISLAPITVLIGENNVGKTNFLTAAGCLFPVILEERLTNFGATIGDTGALNAVEHFVSLNSEVRSAQLGALTSEGTFWVDLYNRHTLLQASYLRDLNLLAVLLTSGSLMRRRWLSKPIGRIDGRRLGQNSDGPRALDYKIGELLQAEFIGSARIALNLNPEAEGPQLDDFEIQLPEMAASLKLNVDDFLKIVSKKLGVPNLRHTPFRYISWPVLPSPVVSRRFERRKLELKALISVLRESDRSTGQAGKAALGEALADLAALENTEGKPGGGGLMLDKGFGLAKGLGSGYRRALLLAGQLLTHDLCLIDEPEIYLHPRMLERLLDFVVERSKSCQVVMTTHSPVVIDYLQQLPNVKMYEVTENAVTPNGQLVDVTSRSMRKVLGELGWRPAHLLQANAIVWVEGPSDVIYVQRWINLWARGRLRPQRDYVCISYGGSLLKHLIAGGADTIWDVNRNSILICDSDKDSPAANVPDYKLGMMTRFEAKGGYAWVTDAREIENYLPRRLLAQRAVVDIPEDYSYVDVPRMLGKDRKKSELAREIAPLLTRKDIEEMPPLAKQIDKICGLLTSWSRIV